MEDGSIEITEEEILLDGRENETDDNRDVRSVHASGNSGKSSTMQSVPKPNTTEEQGNGMQSLSGRNTERNSIEQSGSQTAVQGGSRNPVSSKGEIGNDLGRNSEGQGTNVTRASSPRNGEDAQGEGNDNGTVHGNTGVSRAGAETERTGSHHVKENEENGSKQDDRNVEKVTSRTSERSGEVERVSGKISGNEKAWNKLSESELATLRANEQREIE